MGFLDKMTSPTSTTLSTSGPHTTTPAPKILSGLITTIKSLVLDDDSSTPGLSVTEEYTERIEISKALQNLHSIARQVSY